ncbi:maleylpyruvate isomerase N-terminal domain-containing protein [Streptomyces sp. XM4193]|uniref:maleylpyruvate isomerase N-terminal domain-containing protein n=1 Tax=Streptomyces sp. XM4193 TaxID=2929782 RepID=UPI001FF8DC28|nr:maleylpyruvate isomerase N-terminal domain-containing protein [Streptomyces sp. XM4193]MCK1796938.1 maleylpyruvate isomerase N-terminal domain-containing protein [Streptomyces sp. XM4193]
MASREQQRAGDGERWNRRLLEDAAHYAVGGLAGLTETERFLPTPCAGWHLERLLSHLDASVCALREGLVTGRVAPPPPAPPPAPPPGRSPCPAPAPYSRPAPSARAGHGPPKRGTPGPDGARGRGPAPGADPESGSEHVRGPVADPGSVPRTGRGPATGTGPRTDAYGVAPGAGSVAARARRLAGLVAELPALCRAAPEQGRRDAVLVDGRPLARTLLLRTGALELAVHGWDVRRARSAPDAGPPPGALAERLLTVLPALLPQPHDRGTLFAAPVPVAADADAGTRLLAALGRPL